MPVGALRYEGGKLIIVDQTRLPGELVYLTLETRAQVWEAIKKLQVRGAPAIGVCAAFGVLVGIREAKARTTADAVAAGLETAAYLATSRPTAVNLFNALDRMRGLLAQCNTLASADEVSSRVEAEAVAMFNEDAETCRSLGEHGAALISDGDGVLTHCNAGGLAATQYGTALAAMFRAQELGKKFRVFADETRPLLQGARLTAWELMQAGIDVTLICDNMAAQVMREGRVQLAIVGADRIAANGDAANKIGTYSVAVCCKAHGIPFYVSAPLTTFDFDIENGSQIPIEQRDENEITCGFGTRTAPEGVKVYNPAFDVTPADLIAGIVTEKGILRPPYRDAIAAALKA
ncbi:MAG: S-methyl-5-thioribose-1-phosphate isomerase [Candidatus Hydrogenedentes bacterium]|nr:S-methyl-5-thioribose-1-phosphate isomerase [Candidatus Hydrogenedentota bacterium]